jgi:hypothetical protein
MKDAEEEDIADKENSRSRKKLQKESSGNSYNLTRRELSKCKIN